MKKVSLVLSGGGARGIAHIAVLEELERLGYEIHSITGTSMGAVVGGVYAAGKIKEFKKWVLKQNKKDLVKLLDLTLFHNGFIKGDKLFKELSTFVEDRQIQNLPIKFTAIATDLVSRKEVFFTEGNLLKAMRASTAIPSVLPPVINENSILVDGGVINNLPINRAQRIDNDILIAVNVNASIPTHIKNENKNREENSYYQSLIKKYINHFKKSTSNNKNIKLSYIDIMNDSFEIMRDEIVKLSLEKNPPDILIEIPRHVCSIYAFYKAKELIEIGQKATIKSINNYVNHS